MDYLNIDNINAVESGPICIKNFLTLLCQKDARIRDIFKSNNKKLKEDLKNLRENLEIDKYISAVEFARRIKEYGFMSEMIILDSNDISKHKELFPLFACLKNDYNETVFLYICDINDKGIIVKDMNYNDMLIDYASFEKFFIRRMIAIKDYSEFIKKYCDNKMLKEFANKKYNCNVDVSDGLECVGGVVLGILNVLLDIY